MLAGLLLNLEEQPGRVPTDVSALFITDGQDCPRHRRRCKKRRRKCRLHRRRCHPPLRDTDGKFLRKADEKRFVELTNRMRNKFGQYLKKAA